MKKSIFAVVALAAISGANAQSSVTLYGLIDEGYLSSKINAKDNFSTKEVSINKNESKTQSGISANNTAQSRIGIKTGEDLGGGNTVAAVVEFGFNPNGETSPLNTRQAYVALENKEFGKISVGRQQTKTYEYLHAADGSGSTNLPGSIFYNRGLIGTNLRYNQSILDRSNMVSYGIGNQYYNLYANYAQDSQSSYEKDKNTSGSTHGYGVAGDFSYRGAFVRAAYLKGQLDGRNTLALSSNSNEGSVANAQTYLVSGGYDFNILKSTYTFYQQNVNASNSPITGLASNYKVTYHQLGVVAPVTSRVELFANYVIGKMDGDTNVGKESIGGSGNGYQLGGRYSLSKRTSLYAAYGQQQESWATKNTVLGEKNYEKDVKAYTVGLKHTF